MPGKRKVAPQPKGSRRARFTAGIAQAAPAVLDLSAGIEKACRLITEAGRLGCRLLVFPETWLPCYPLWCDWGTLGKWDHGPCKQLHARLRRNSPQISSPEINRIAAAARKSKMAVILGLNERDRRSGTLYNSLLFITEKGEIAGRHRKLVPTFGERLVWGQGDGSGLRTHSLGGIQAGGLVCWEHWMPLARQVLHAEGEQLHAAVWPQLQERHLLASRHYAFEGGCFVLAASSFMTRAMFPRDFELREDLDSQPEVLLNGGSAILGPDGGFLAGPVAGKEKLLVAELDLGRVYEEKLALDVAGHYSRPDIFQLAVDRGPRPQFTDLSPDSRPPTPDHDLA